MLFNLDFANNTVLSCFFFFFLIIDLYFSIPAVIAEIYNPIAEIIPTGKPTKEYLTFNISIDSSSLNNFSSSLLHLLHIIERTNVFSKRYENFDFSNFLCLPQITKYYLIIFLVFEKFSYRLSYFIILFIIIKEKIKLYTLINFYLLA